MKDEGILIGLGAGFILIILLISAIIGGFLWPYAINEWLVFFGQVPAVEFWHGMILGVCPYIGQMSLPAVIITFIAMIIL